MIPPTVRFGFDFSGFCPARRIWLWVILSLANAASGQPFTFGGDAQHTAVYQPKAQSLNKIRWSTSINLHNTGEYGHYGAPLVTTSNTVIVPVKTATGFQISAFEGATGRLKYTLPTDFIIPPYTNSWFPAYQPVIATPPSGPRLYYAGAGGTTYYVENLDSDNPASPVHECFYTNLAAYAASANGTNGYTNTVFINTPLTAGPDGVVYFGFRTQLTPPPPLNTNSGFARLDSAGNATYVFAGAAASDPVTYRDSHNSAPALSNDGSTLYVPVKAAASSRCYLLGLDSVTLATKYRVKMLDPRNGMNAQVLDISTASPLIGPDDDVYFGIFANPNNGSRGFLLHFSADLQTNKPPGAFGWDNTAAIVPATMVPSYTGSSSYLLFSKYNNYADTGGEGDGINRLALLDPNATQIDPHSSANGLTEMREVLTVIGCTPDAEYLGTNYPYAVREWCINTATVNPATSSVFAPSEDGHLYRWDLAANSLTEAAKLSPGIGEPYVPTIIAPDGTVITLNGGTLFAVGSLSNVGITVSSSSPDLRATIVGDSITFTAIVTNLAGSNPVPTGSVTFQDITWHGITPVTNLIASSVPLTNGIAAVTTAGLSADTNNFGNHLITAVYGGDGTFPGGSATLVQKVHPRATLTTLTSGRVGSTNAVVFTSTTGSIGPANAKPSGMVSFWDGSTLVRQIPIKTNGVASFTNANFSPGSHAMRATYASDTMFAASAGAIVPTPPILVGQLLLANGGFQLTFTNSIGALFSVLGSQGAASPMTNWTLLGSPIEFAPGNFQFTDPTLANNRLYQLRSP